MAIDFTCRHCGWAAVLHCGYAGQSGRCPRCGNAIAIPPLNGRVTRFGQSCEGGEPRLRRQFIAPIFLHALPCALAGLHLIVMSIWVPLAIATINAEAAPFGAGLIAWIDWLAVAVISFGWLETFIPAHPRSIVWVICLMAIFGTLQWYAIGMFAVIGFRVCRFLRRLLSLNETDECLDPRTSKR